MGRKGVSKRKPKKNKSISNDNSSSNTRPGESSPVQSLVKNYGGVTNPAPGGSNKKNRKGK